MKIKLMFIAVAALAMGTFAHAKDFKVDATEQIMNALNKEGLLANLPDADLDDVETMVGTLINDQLNLREGSIEAFSLGDVLKTAKDVVKVGADIVKTMTPHIMEVAKKYGPQLISMGKQMLPVAAPAAAQLAGELKLPPTIVNAAMGLVPKSVQQSGDTKKLKEEAMKNIASLTSKLGGK